jgi:ADP-ribose pyrophosphatase
MESWIDRKTVFSGKVFTVASGRVRLDDGSHAQRDVVDHAGGVGIVPILGNDVALIRQFRIAIGREIIEIPAGRLEQGEDPETCACRELEEELGLQIGKLVLAHAYYSTVGFSNERMYVYIASELQETAKNLEWDERIQLVRMPVVEVETRLNKGEFEDSKTIIGLYALLRYLKTA